MTVLVGMFLLGLFIALGTWTLSWSNHVKRELVVKVEFNTSADPGGQATRAQETAVGKKLATNQLLNSFAFIWKEQALAQMKKSNPGLTVTLPYNPLPDEFTVKPVRAEDIQALNQSLHPLAPGVHQIIDGKHYSKKILSFAKWLDIIFIVAV